MVIAVAEYRMVRHLPDLISPEEYDAHPHGGLVRVRIAISDEAVEVLGDAIRPELLEAVLETLGGGEVIEQMMCG
jgi:FtsH ternary system-associated peptide